MLLERSKRFESVLLQTCGAWHLPYTARAFHDRGALAGLWISHKNSTGHLGRTNYHRMLAVSSGDETF